MPDSEFAGEQQGAFQGTDRRYRRVKIKPLSSEQREQLQEQQQLYLLERMSLEQEIREDQELVLDLRWQHRRLALPSTKSQEHWQEQQAYQKQRDGLEKLIRNFRDDNIARYLKIQELPRPGIRRADYIHDDCSLRTGILVGKKAPGRVTAGNEGYYCLFCEKGY